MRKLVYHIATTIDNYIAHHDGSANGFLMEGDHASDYVEHLKLYDTVVMGRGTYEIGYTYGMQPGEAPYPHMQHYIFSKTLKFSEAPAEQIHVIDSDPAAFIREMKQGSGSDIYLCGGGAFAGFLYEQELIDTLIIKLNPVIFGGGIRLFGNSAKNAKLHLLDSKKYHSGVMLLTYRIAYSSISDKS